MKRIIAALLCLMVLAGCAKTPKDPPKEPENKPDVVTPEPEKKPEPPVVKKPTHPLTGLETDMSEELLNRKPVAVMVGNSKAAQPQLGISTADILVEMMAEGGTTRIMAIWQDSSKVGRIGSVRSARPYFIDMAQWLDAYFMHFGGSVPAYEAIGKRKDLVAMDGIRGGYEGSLYIRDPERKKKYALEHTAVTSGERIETTLQKFENKQKRDLDQTAFHFNDQHSALLQADANKITLDYFTINKPYFIYDKEQDVYTRFQYGAEHTDGEYNVSVTVQNLIVLEMPLAPVPGDPLKIIEVQTTGSGTGKYFADGSYVDIKWSKGAYNKPLELFTADDRPLQVKPGKTFLAVIKTGGKITIEE